MPLPHRPNTRPLLHDAMPLVVEPTRLASRRRQPTLLAMLHRRARQPVDLRVVADRVVVRIDQNHLEVLVRRVLVDPVRVQHAQVAAPGADALFRDRPLVARELQLGHSLVVRLAVLDALLHRALAAAATDADCDAKFAGLCERTLEICIGAQMRSWGFETVNVPR